MLKIELQANVKEMLNTPKQCLEGVSQCWGNVGHPKTMLRGLEPMLRKCWTPQNNVKRAWAKDEKMFNLNSPPPPSNNNVKRACANAEEMLNQNHPPPATSTMWSRLEKMLRKCLTPHNNIEGRGGGDVKKISVETVAKRVNYFTFHWVWIFCFFTLCAILNSIKDNKVPL